jgi:hypothetical protein
MPYTPIREEFGSILGPDTGYIDGYFVAFLSPSRQITAKYFN